MKFKSVYFAGKTDRKEKKSPFGLFIPTLYFAEGLPYVLVNLVSVPMYSKLGVSNELIGLYTSILMWPWVIKMMWGPIVDRYSSKRTWLLSTQIICCIFFVAIAFVLETHLYLTLTLILFFLLAFVSATHDIAIDGFYMLALSIKQQAIFVGIRSLFYRISIIFGTGALVYFVGIAEKDFGVPVSWKLGFLICAGIFLCLFLFHLKFLPFPASDSGNAGPEKIGSFVQHYLHIFKHFLSQDKIIPIFAFILLYRFGEAQLSKMVPPFLLNAQIDGGLGFTTESYGFIQGIIGSSSLITGGIIGGWIIARYGLRKCIWPMALSLNVPNLVYVYLAFTHPSVYITATAIAIEQFGYGLGFSAFMMFLLQISKGAHRTSLYAIATGIMALGMMIPGMVSGYLQQWLGYKYFFIAATLMTIPGMIAIFYIPIDETASNASDTS